MLSDGTCVEVHRSSLRESLQATVDGMQDVLQAANQQAFNGNVADFVASLSAATTRPAVNDADHAQYDVIYVLHRDVWLRFVKANMASTGYESTLEGVRQRLYEHRPFIKAC